MRYLLFFGIYFCLSLSSAAKSDSSRVVHDRMHLSWIDLQTGDTLARYEMMDSLFSSTLIGISSYRIFPDFRAKNFISHANFNLSRFYVYVDFSFSQFQRANFGNSLFLSNSNWNRAEFNGSANFRQATFNEVCDFSEIKFEKAVSFMEVNFLNLADFSDSQFNGITNFAGSSFERSADFSWSFFNAPLNFNGAKFNEPVFFHHSILGSTSDFSELNCLDFMDFSMSRFDTLLLSNSNFEHYCSFNSTSANHLFTDGLNFHDTLDLRGYSGPAIFDLTHSKKKRKKKNRGVILADRESIPFLLFDYDQYILGFKNQSSEEVTSKKIVYEKMLSRFQEEGMKSSYTQLGQQYAEFQYLELRMDPTDGVSRTYFHVRNFLDKHWWGYGFNKTLIVRNITLLVLAFFIINWIFFKRLNEETYRIDSVYSPYKKRLSIKLTRSLYLKSPYPQDREYYDRKIFRNYVYTAGLALYYTTMIFFGVKISFTRINYKNLLAASYIYLQFGMGIVCLLFFINYIITM